MLLSVLLSLLVFSLFEHLISSQSCNFRSQNYVDGAWHINETCLSTVLQGFKNRVGIVDVLSSLGFSEVSIRQRNGCFSRECKYIFCKLSPTEDVGEFVWSDNSVVHQKLQSLCWQWHPRKCSLARLGFAPKETGQHLRPSFHTLVDKFGGICAVGDSLHNQFHEDLISSGIASAQFSRASLLVNAFNLRPLPPSEIERCRRENADLVITPEFFAKGRAGSRQSSEYVCLPDINQRYNETVRKARSGLRELTPGSSYLLQYQEWTELLPRCNGLLLLQTGHWWWLEQKNASFYERMVKSILG